MRGWVWVAIGVLQVAWFVVCLATENEALALKLAECQADALGCEP